MLKINLSQFQKNVPINIFEKVLKENLGITNEQLLILGDEGYKTTHLLAPIMTNAFSIAANNLGITNSTVYQTTKGRGESADVVLLRELKNLPPKSVVVVNVSNRFGKMQYLGKSFRSFCKIRGHRFISAASLGMISNEKLKDVVNSFNVNTKQIERKAFKLKEILDHASTINVITKKGTDVEVGIQNMKARVASGIYLKPGTGGNSIPAETYIAPAKNSVNGTIVIDGSIRTLNKTIICTDVVKMEIKKSEIVSMNSTPEALQLKSSIAWAEKKSKIPYKVKMIGELGIGLNPNAKIIGSTIVDEKAFGTAHFAIGSNAWFGGDIYSIIHLDQVLKDPIFKIDGRLLHL
jgi:hypothetical protein